MRAACETGSWLCPTPGCKAPPRLPPHLGRLLSQVAAALAPLFARVISRGAAPEHHLELPTNATHLLMALEGRLPAAVPEGGVDLLMADLHWLDPPTFFREARRVLAPSGALAAWGYDAPIVVSPPGRMLDPVALAHLR